MSSSSTETCPRAIVSSARARSPLAEAAVQHTPFIWRCLKRFGVRPDHAVDDAVQRVFEIAVTKQDRITAGCERAFLFKTALLVAVEVRRARRRGDREQADESIVLCAQSSYPDPDEALEEREWRSRLDEVLDALPLNLRTVFVLFELEELPTAEIGELLNLPVGTVASRLRRARSAFHLAARRLRARLDFGGECT